ncbi:HD domain-containing phosphohydrolase [Chloroflexota bacterium]
MATKQEIILVIDDEDVVRKLLCYRLSYEGSQCQEAGSADQAAEELNNGPVDLVILDIEMPGKSGVELLPEIIANYPDTVVLMAATGKDIRAAIQCIRQGAYDYITKPFDLDSVALHVGIALEKRRLKLQNRDYQQHLEQKVATQAKKIRNSFLNSITALAYALEVRDKYTSGHSHRVSEISIVVANELGISQDRVDTIKLAGLIHDIGKIGVRESILNKPGKLTAEEYQQIKYHCEEGEHILIPIVEDDEILKMVRNHHERYDGNGYPDHLKGEQIPLGARILAVSDAYDAMTSLRPYRKLMSPEEASIEIEHCISSQFDPDIADAFLTTRKSINVKRLVKV